MKYIYSIIKADYQQRTRSYAFLITLAVTLFVAYSFTPAPDASYTTLNATGFKGIYNAAWVGYVSGIMTSVMLSLYGFFLVNSGIKKDIDTEVGLIIATTSITNFGYLLSKFLSNLLVLLTIAGSTLLVSIGMFFFRSSGYPFVFLDFLLPYLLFAVPALVLVSATAIVFEVFLTRKSILQYIVYFFLAGAVMASVSRLRGNSEAMDPFGLSVVTNSIKTQINTQFHQHIEQVSFGFIFEHHKPYKSFLWNGVKWNGMFIFSRLLWICLAFVLVYISSFFFHRFDFKHSPAGKKKSVIMSEQTAVTVQSPAGISLAQLPPVVADYSILPFIKTEFLLLIRKGSVWLWIINAVAWIAMLFIPLTFAYDYLLPVLIFIQVTRLSDLATKEKTNRLHYFTYSSYKPLQRMLPAQILAGVLLILMLSLPVIVRLFISGSALASLSILNGCVFIVLLAVCVGIVSGGKKLFEIVFFMLTYALIQHVPATAYLGGMSQQNPTNYGPILLMINLFLVTIAFSVRNYQARHL